MLYYSHLKRPGIFSCWLFWPDSKLQICSTKRRNSNLFLWNKFIAKKTFSAPEIRAFLRFAMCEYCEYQRVRKSTYTKTLFFLYFLDQSFYGPLAGTLLVALFIVVVWLLVKDIFLALYFGEGSYPPSQEERFVYLYSKVCVYVLT